MENAIDAKNKIYFIDGTLAKQNPHTLYSFYLEKKCNLMKKYAI